MVRSRCLFFCMILVCSVISAFAAPAEEQSVFDETLRIGNRQHLISLHLFGTVNSSPDSATISAGFQMVDVPDVAGMPQEEAQASIIAAKLTLGTVTQENSATLPLGSVINQDPAAGDSVPENSSVHLVVSLGPVMVNIPDLAGMLQSDAEAAISAAGLIVGLITDVHSAAVPAGHVISQNPAAGSNVQEGFSVDLSVSLGPVMVIVPNVVGMELTGAKADISGANLVFGWISTVQSDLIPKNQVVEQMPLAATSVPENATVDLVVSFPEGDDDDNDGLADAWEYGKFGNLLQGTDDDSDGDGYSNYQEYLIGTDPNDPGEAPVPAGNFYEYDEFGRMISKQITLEPECDGANCSDDACEGTDCGEDTCGSYGNWYCQDESIRRRDRTCIDRGCSAGVCYEYNFTDYEPEFCPDGCIDGICVTYSWYTGACNVPCGGGTRPVYCRRSDGARVADNLCSGPKPSTGCNPQECPEVCYYKPGNGGTYFYESCKVECIEYKYGWEGMKKVPIGCLNWTLDCYWQLHFNDTQLVFKLNEMAPETYEKSGYRYQKGAVMREPSCDPHDLSCHLYQHWWGVTTTRLCNNCGGCN